MLSSGEHPALSYCLSIEMQSVSQLDSSINQLHPNGFLSRKSSVGLHRVPPKGKNKIVK